MWIVIRPNGRRKNFRSFLAAVTAAVRGAGNAANTVKATYAELDRERRQGVDRMYVRGPRGTVILERG